MKKILKKLNPDRFAAFKETMETFEMFKVSVVLRPYGTTGTTGHQEEDFKGC